MEIRLRPLWLRLFFARARVAQGRVHAGHMDFTLTVRPRRLTRWLMRRRRDVVARLLHIMLMRRARTG
jgi:hypothetical protein